MNRPRSVFVHTAVSALTHNHLDVGSWHYERWGGYKPSRIRNDLARFGGYTIVINEDDWEQTRAFDEETIACRGRNNDAIHVVVMGNGDNHRPTLRQREIWTKEVWPFITRSFPDMRWDDVEEHRDYANKSCPGRMIPKGYYGNLIRENMFTPSKKDQVKALKRTVAQLMSRLIVLLQKERMKG